MGLKSGRRSKRYPTLIWSISTLCNLQSRIAQFLQSRFPLTQSVMQDRVSAGQSVKLSSMAREPYPPATIKFKVDNRYLNYWVLWKWLDLINHSETGDFNNLEKDEDPEEPSATDRLALRDPYITQMTLQAKDEFNKPVIEFNFIGAFITELGEIEYDYQDPTQITCSFTFEYTSLHANLVR
jgi:hypothetical protein